MTAIEAATTCIHAHPCGSGQCHPVAIVPQDVYDMARDFKSRTWTEIVGAADGYSADITAGALHTHMQEAYRVAAGEAKGKLVWLRTPDYSAERWIPDPVYTDWINRFGALQTRDERVAMRENEPPPAMGHWEPRTGACLCFLTLGYDGRLRFTG